MRIKLQHVNPPTLDDEGIDGPLGYYFEIQADGNHETLATSEIYNTRADALHAIMMISDTDTTEWRVVDETDDRD